MMQDFSVVPPNAQKKLFLIVFLLSVCRAPFLLESSIAHVFYYCIGLTSHHLLQYDSENCITNGAGSRRNTSHPQNSFEETLKHRGSTFRDCTFIPLHAIGFVLRDHWSPASQRDCPPTPSYQILVNFIGSSSPVSVFEIEITRTKFFEPFFNRLNENTGWPESPT